MNENIHPPQGQPESPEPAHENESPAPNPPAPSGSQDFGPAPASPPDPQAFHPEGFAGGPLAEAMGVEGGEWVHPQLQEGANHPETQGHETPAAPSAATPTDRMNHLLDLHLPLAIELGRTEMSVAEILELDCGSIVELDRMAGEPVDLLINNQPVAKGEVVVIDDKFGIRITQLVKPGDRISSL